MVQTTGSRGYLYVPGEAGPSQAPGFEARVPTARCAGGLHAGSHAHTMSQGLAVFQSRLSCRREGLDVWDIFIFWMVSKAECFFLASEAERALKTSHGRALPCALYIDAWATHQIT